METFLLVLKYISGPIIGALIGYFTNWLAVKMLFRPYYPKKIGRLKVPFTPGIIPKRKPALAKAVGKAVGEELLTKDDIVKAMTGGQAKDKICEYAVSAFHANEGSSVKEIASKFTSEEQVQTMESRAEEFLSEKIYSAAINAGIGQIVAEEGAKVINEKKASLGMLAMFLSDDLIGSLMNKLASGVDNYVQTNGQQFISDAVKKETQKAVVEPISSFVKDIDDETIKNIVGSAYDFIVGHVASQLLEGIDISAIVEEKINAMDIKDLEKLVLSVMKKELNAIVNLGALIGFILGIVMVFI
jgi:uncharacterized membrane protein YheB (UPF0754 family)